MRIPSTALSRPTPASVRLENGRIEHGARLRVADEVLHPPHEPVERVGARGNDHSGIRAELPHAQGDRRREPFGDRLGTFGERSCKQEDGVHAAHFRVHGNRIGAAGRGIEQGAPGAQAAGEADRFRVPMLDERRRDVVARALDQRKDARRHAAGLARLDDRAGDQLGGGRVRRVCFHDDRAPGGQRGGRVASRNGERQREVARPEHGDRADRNQHPADIKLRQRLAIGNRAVDAGVHPRALANQVREHPQLCRSCVCARRPDARAAARSRGSPHPPDPRCARSPRRCDPEIPRAARRTAGGIRATRCSAASSARSTCALEASSKAALVPPEAKRPSAESTGAPAIRLFPVSIVTTSPAACRRPSRAVRPFGGGGPAPRPPGALAAGTSRYCRPRVSYITGEPAKSPANGDAHSRRPVSLSHARIWLSPPAPNTRPDSVTTSPLIHRGHARAR